MIKLGKIKDKKEQSIVNEHWVKEKEHSETLVKYAGCNMTNLSLDSTCLVKRSRNRGKRVLKKGTIRKKEERKYESRILLEILNTNRIKQNKIILASEPYIFIDSFENQKIDRYIVTKSYKDKLKEIAKCLAPASELSIYTNGSLKILKDSF